MDWKRELVIAHLVKQKIAEADVDGVWENTLPEVAASENQLMMLEDQLGYGLDPQYREFLRHANGWRAFKNYIDVFGTEDFLGGSRAARAAELVESLEPLEPLCGLGKRDVLSIAVSTNDIDVMLVACPHTESPGQVFWFAGGLVETFPSFNEWFLAMVDYLRLNYQRLVEKHAH